MTSASVSRRPSASTVTSPKVSSPSSSSCCCGIGPALSSERVCTQSVARASISTGTRQAAFPREHHAMHRLRAATDADARAIADVWHAAWPDAHDAGVPSTLVDERPLAYFRGRSAELIDRTTVAEDDSG